MALTERKAHAGLWVIQSLLAALFLFAGGFKLALPLAELAKLVVGVLALTVAYGRWRGVPRSESGIRAAMRAGRA